MRQKIKIYAVALACLSIFTASCASFPLVRTEGAALSPALRKLVSDAVFEVVLEKAGNDPVTYEKPLNWETVPYAIRSDKYYSIGTAFAVSNTELATAFHVINLGNDSKVYTKYYIRDAAGSVFEIDQVVAGSSERDFLIFTVKNRVFTEYFTLKKDFSINEPVYSIGNALGEGIIVRSGMVLGTVPESESGRWNLLKSSADGNPGNSGGPLVTPKGQVVGLVTSLRDNILYSTPADVVFSYQRKTLSYRIKPSYEHLLLTNNLSKTFEMEIKLPQYYKAVQHELTEAYTQHYVSAMTELFADAPEYLTGANNAYLLSSVMTSVFPQLDFVDSNDNNWKLSRLDAKSINFADDGRLLYSNISGFNFFLITRPKSVPLEKLNTNPRFIMDTILENWRTERTLWRGDKYRILSLGDPAATGEYRDIQGRMWITAHWIIGFDDKVMVMYILPLPGGPAVITTIQSSDDLFVYQWDIQKLTDHLYAAYSAPFEDWKAYLRLKNYIPAFLSEFKFNLSAKQGVQIALPDFSLKAANDIFSWTERSELILIPAYYKLHDEVKLGITKTTLYRNNRHNDYITITKSLKPDARLGIDYRNLWDDLLEEKFPYNNRAALSPRDNNGSIGAVIQPSFPDDDVRWTLYMTAENLDEAGLTEKFSKLKTGLGIIR